ncbi:uncharacterized protein LOC107290004, partial [Protobothrops mucrosquamatus]|uniref:uncharacterized protein LOC107290004 n=1 Tax=Protobothrops mucrosquamatus TaxID=103944 RepID=UPI000775F136
MGGKSSVPSTPLQCMLQGFDHYFNHTKYKVPYPPVSKDRLRFLCEDWWPHLDVGWPPEGTFNTQLIDDLTSLIAANEENYPNQFQYIDQWGDAVAERADDLLQCQAEMVRLCVVRPKGKKLKAVEKKYKDVKIAETKLSDLRKEVLVEEEEAVLRPPPYVPQPPPPPQPVAAPPLLQPGAGAAAQAEGVQAVVRRRGGKSVPTAPKEEKGGVRDHPGGEAEELSEEGSEETEIAVSTGVMTRSKARRGELLAPLRQMDQHVMDQQGAAQIKSIFQYVLFTTTDLLNWKQHYGPLTVKPTEMADLFQTIMQTHNPTWQDIQQLLNTLLTPEEKEKWRAAVRTCVRDRNPAAQDLQAVVLAKAPETDPGWNVRDDAHMTALKEYQNLVVEALLAAPVHIRQRSCSNEAIVAIYESIQRYLKAGILVPIQSPWNTPILPIRKPDGSYRPVQDLRVINSMTVTIHPVVPNPYTLLSLIPPKAAWFSVIDLKDAFFTIPIHEASQPLFAFEWENPRTGLKSQYTWTRLPQGFKNSPTLFGTALGKDLQHFVPRQRGDTLLQYVDDVLVTGQTEDTCWDNTASLLGLLSQCGYRVSRKKAQLVKQKVRYLGYDIGHGHRALGWERKQAVLAIAEPTNRRQLRGFLGLAGFCRIWIPNYALMAAPLYAATKGGEHELFCWGGEQKKAFRDVKLALTSAPAIALPNLEKAFNLYVDTRDNVALGVLTQQLGQWQRPVAYLSKQLDGVAQGWPHCLKVLAAIAVLLQDCNKLTFSCPVNVHTPHAVQAILDNKGHLWISNQRLFKYQALMIENPQVRLIVSNRLNPATLLPGDINMEHDCLQVLESVYSSRHDLSDIPMQTAQLNWYTDGSSYMHEGKRVSGYAIVDDEKVVESGPLGPEHSAQVAELWALLRALERAVGETLNVWTDSKYAFLTLHAHGAVYKERGFRDSAGKYVQHGHLIQRLLNAVQMPTKVAVMHCKGHQRGVDKVAQGNRRADLEARIAARRGESTIDLSIHVAMDLGVIPPTIRPTYSQQECVKAVTDLKATLKDGWYVLSDGRIFVPQSSAWALVQSSHDATHMGKLGLEEAWGRDYYINGVAGMAARVVSQCATCAK